MKPFFITILLTLVLTCSAQEVRKVYDETIDPIAQIDAAIAQARQEGKNVVCQVGGNWCPWCLRFADFIVQDTTISKTVTDNYVYIHVNYPRRNASKQLSQRLGNPGRFGFPVMVVLDANGTVRHIQDSSYLEEGKGYNQEKVLRFFNNWTPAVLGQ